MSLLDIQTADVFEPLSVLPARYRGAYGGRGSAKSHYFAGKLVKRCLKSPGTRWLCTREVQKSLKDSAKLLIEDKIAAYQAPGFEVQHDLIKTPGGGLIVFQGMSKQNADSVKSFEGFHGAWIEEASSFSKRSLDLLEPTIFRTNDSELWASWNPTRKTDAVDQLLRGPERPKTAVVVETNWSKNPWFPEPMEELRQRHLLYNPAYRHIWEGEYATIVEGAYYASQLALARSEGRITPLAYDPILQRKAFWDIGYSDSTAIWIAQWVGQQIRVLDYIEGQGQELSYYVNELRNRGHESALCYLPHDGAHHHVGKSVEEHLRDAEFKTKLVPNQGKGAALSRIEAARRLFPRMIFDPRVESGLEALGAYHERRDEQRGVGLGPEHDWASDAADAFGLMCIAYDEPRIKRTAEPATRLIERASAGTGWMEV